MKIGIDVGGSHVGLGIIDEDGKLLLKNEMDYLFHNEDMSDIVVDTIIGLIYKTIRENNIDKNDIELIGVTFPGTVAEGVVVKAENLGIENLNIEKELKAEFNVPIYLQNDAKSAAKAEKCFGSLKDYDDALFLIIGTGVGGAAFLGGELLTPKRYSGFEVGHMVIHKDGEKCNCGRSGCFEAYASMKRLKLKMQKEFDLPDIDGRNIKKFMLENKDNEKLNDILDTYIDYLSIGICNLINIFEPEIISIGGSFAHYKEILVDRLEKKLLDRKELYNKDTIPKIVVAELKNDAGIIGAVIR